MSLSFERREAQPKLFTFSESVIFAEVDPEQRKKFIHFDTSNLVVKR